MAHMKRRSIKFGLFLSLVAGICVSLISANPLLSPHRSRFNCGVASKDPLKAYCAIFANDADGWRTVTPITSITPTTHLGLGVYIRIGGDEGNYPISTTKGKVNDPLKQLFLNPEVAAIDVSNMSASSNGVLVKIIKPTAGVASEKKELDSVVKYLLSVLEQKQKNPVPVSSNMSGFLSSMPKLPHLPLSLTKDGKLSFTNVPARIDSTVERVTLKNGQNCLLVYQTTKTSNGTVDGMHVWIFPELSTQVTLQSTPQKKS